MTRKLAILISTSFVMSIGLVIMLFALSHDMRQQPGSFLREFPPHPALEGEVLDLKYNSYYIAGGTEHAIYLANYTNPLHLLIVNNTLSDTQQVQLQVKDIEEQKFWSVRVKVDSPYYYLTDGAVPIIYRGNVQDWKSERYAHDRTYFQDLVPISNESFLIRALGKPGRENTLGKLTTALPHLRMKAGILEKQVDGIFCTDGMMEYSKTRNELFYFYRYRNEYMAMDTSLNVLRRQHTIDTTTRVRIAVGAIESTGATTLASPPRVVNRHVSIWGNQIFVNSLLLAKNEHRQAHDNETVIDVYHVRTGDYQFSFYIYDYQGKEKLKTFSVFGNKLYALFGQYLQVWDLTPTYFNH